MSYKCRDCGNIFDECDCYKENMGECHGSIAYETFAVCPCCGSSDFDGTNRCKRCGGEFLEDELFDGWCGECLKNSITHDSALCFMEENDILMSFMFEKFWESSIPEKISEFLKEIVCELFLRRKADDLLCDKTDFLNVCKEFILEDDGDFGKIAFAEWLNEKEVK